MKKYGFLVPIVLTVLLVLSWYKLVTDTNAVEDEFNNYIQTAREYAEDGITKYAITNYEKALEINDDPVIYAEVASYYKRQGESRKYLSWCEEFFEKYPKESLAYDTVLEAYMTEEDYSSCWDILDTAEKRNITSEYINKVRTDIRYEYYLDYNSYDDVGIFSNDLCPVAVEDKWGFVNRKGSRAVSCKYKAVGYFTSSGMASVIDMDGQAYYIDSEGYKVLVTKTDYTEFGNITEGKIVAKKSNGKYVYTDINFNELSAEYDYAGSFNLGKAAVKNGTEWLLIGNDFSSDGKYADIKLDEKTIAYRNDRAFVSENGKTYKMIDLNGSKIGDEEYEDAIPFDGDDMTAVCKDGKWFFIDKEGRHISDNTYEKARSFSNGLAAVCIDGKWGFVDESENIVIEPQYEETKDFNDLGSCFVNTGKDWQMIKLYALNR